MWLTVVTGSYRQIFLIHRFIVKLWDIATIGKRIGEATLCWLCWLCQNHFLDFTMFE